MMIQGREYSLIMGSDPERDGVFLELYDGTQANGSPQAEYFYSDGDGSFSLTVYDDAVPKPALEWLQSEGVRRLPASESTT